MKSVFKKYISKSLLFLILVLILGIMHNANTASGWNIDKNIESERDKDTDLYDASKCYNVMPLNITISDGTKATRLLDEDFITSVSLKKDTEIKVSCESPMHSIYVIWDSLVPEWTMKIGDESYTYGKNGFLHEYITLPKETTELTIVIPDGSVLGNLSGVYKGGMRVSDIYAFPDDCTPSFVQKWEPTLTDADILVISTHGDDEHIFFGGFLPTYSAEQDKKVQLVYFTNHWTYSSSSKLREHEKLNGMWLAGAKNYPIVSDFTDSYSMNLADAKKVISEEDAVSFLTDVIRQTHPLVVVIHDKNGEYGHGQHRLSSMAAVQAVQNASQESFNPDSATAYGTWNTPKLYMHIDKENELILNLRTPLTFFGGKTAIQVARQAYLCHQSQQQYTDFTVDDYGKYNNAAFGLIYSTIGLDKNHNDVLENIDYDNIDALRTKSATPKTGTIDDFTPIYTAEDLKLIEKDCYGKFRLMCDIDMTGIDWKPVDFYGVFDGNGHALLNLQITQLGDNTEISVDGNRKEYVTKFSGFFGLVRHAEIYDFSLLGINVNIDSDCDTFIGTLAGYTYDTIIRNCTVTGEATLTVTGKMFGVGGLIGFGGNTEVDACTVDTILINIDKDKDSKDEQFLGGVFADGYMSVKDSTIIISGYTSDHGYVHDGGISGMFIRYDGTTNKSEIKNNKITGFIRFFEDNSDRRAYCKDTIGENMNSSAVTISGNVSDFKRDEIKVYDKDLLPHYCTGEKYSLVDKSVLSINFSDCNPADNYDLYICDECHEYTFRVYYIAHHNVTNKETFIEPTYTEEGMSKGICDTCGKEIYEIMEVIPLPTPTPTPLPTNTPVPTPTNVPTQFPTPSAQPDESQFSSLFNKILVIISLVIIAVVLTFIPTLVKRNNK